VAVRNFAGSGDRDDFLQRVTGGAGVRRALVIAGDRDQPAGPFRSAIEVIDSGALQRHGLVEIAIAGYPDGHPRLSQQELDRALADKIHAAETTGIAVHIVTQFCFDARSIINWIGRLRDFGIEHPVRIGFAGPTNLATLLRYGQRCGVRASIQGLARQAGLVRQLFAMSAPDALLRPLAEARADMHLGDVSAHFFSFGGLSRTARWVAAVAERRIALEPGEGFRVEPPPARGRWRRGLPQYTACNRFSTSPAPTRRGTVGAIPATSPAAPPPLRPNRLCCGRIRARKAFAESGSSAASSPAGRRDRLPSRPPAGRARPASRPD